MMMENVYTGPFLLVERLWRYVLCFFLDFLLGRYLGSFLGLAVFIITQLQFFLMRWTGYSG